jgi:hypothetical protein
MSFRDSESREKLLEEIRVLISQTQTQTQTQTHDDVINTFIPKIYYNEYYTYLVFVLPDNDKIADTTRYDILKWFKKQYSDVLSLYGEVVTQEPGNEWCDETFLDPLLELKEMWVEMGIPYPTQTYNHLAWILMDNESYEKKIKELENKLTTIREKMCAGRWATNEVIINK